MGYDISEMHPDTEQQVWLKKACMQCVFTHHGPERDDCGGEVGDAVAQNRCPNDGSVLLVMEGTVVSDDVIAIAQLLAKADRAKHEAEVAAVTARADLGRVNDIVNRRVAGLSSITR